MKDLTIQQQIIRKFFEMNEVEKAVEFTREENISKEEFEKAIENVEIEISEKQIEINYYGFDI